MGLEELESEIAADYKDKISSLQIETTKKCREIISSFEADAEKILAEARAKALDDVSSIEMMEQAASRIDAAKIENEAMEKIAERVLEAVGKGLIEYGNSREYEERLPRYVEKAASVIRGDVVVKARKKDKKLLSNYQVEDIDLECMGGAIVEATDSSVCVDVTLDALFEQAKPGLRKVIYQRVFG